MHTRCPLAAASRARIESLPDVPTLGEIIQTDFDEDVWFGAVLPAKTPKQHVSQLADWFRAAVLAADLADLTRPIAAEIFLPVDDADTAPSAQDGDDE